MIKKIVIDATATSGQLSIKNLRFAFKKDEFLTPVITKTTSSENVDFSVGNYAFNITASNVYSSSYPVENIINTSTANTPKFSTASNGGKMEIVFEKSVGLLGIAFDIPSATNSTSPWTLNTYGANNELRESFEVPCSNGEAMAKRQFAFNPVVRCFVGKDGLHYFLRAEEVSNG